MRKFEFLPAALEEMSEAAEYYERQRSGLGDEFLAEVRLAMGQVRQRPKTWAEVRPGVRRYYVKRFPFAIIYAQEGMLIIILAVMHLRKNPSCWHGRV